MRIRAMGLCCALASTSCSDTSASNNAQDSGAPAPDANAAQDAARDAAPDVALSDAPLPTYAAGVTTRTWIDAHRPTPQNGSAPAQASRTLVTEIWYPAGAATGGGSTATRDAPLASGGPFPVVLFVHGSGSGRLFYSYLASGLAQAGYIALAADFPLTAMTTAGGASDEHVSDEVADLSFLDDQMANATDALKGAALGEHYAVVGHSTGGAVSLLAAFAGDDDLVKHDSRVSAVVPLSGDACMFDASFFKTRSVPIFIMGATDDLFVPIATNGQWTFSNTNTPHLFATLIGGEHTHFTDFDLEDSNLSPVPTGPTSTLATALSKYGNASECLPVPPAGTDATMSTDTQHALVVQWVTAFLDVTMRQNSRRLTAARSANNPLVVLRE